MMALVWSAALAQDTAGEPAGRKVERPGRTGLPLPRFVSLRAAEVNLRTGPGVRYPIDWVYHRRGLPVEVIDEFGSFAAWAWSHEPGPGARPKRIDHKTLLSLTRSPQSIEMSRDLKRRGFTFVGPTICYAFMQAIGMVNDHVVGCFRYKQVFKQESPVR